MKKVKMLFILLVVEIGLLYVFGLLTYSNGVCLENNNWYWTTNTNPAAVFNCPNLPESLPPASTSSKAKFEVFQGLQVIIPITALVGLIVVIKQRKA